VNADPDRLLQVLTNLLSNAVKFSPAGEEVAVSISRRGTTLRVAVSDRGPGVPPGFRKRIFRKFAQERSVQPRQRGSGLGLAISKAIITGLGGRIDYETGQHGSTFYFELPEWDGEGRPAAHDASDCPGPQLASILGRRDGQL
jgi:signal transduction histidine kinase